MPARMTLPSLPRGRGVANTLPGAPLPTKALKLTEAERRPWLTPTAGFWSSRPLTEWITYWALTRLGLRLGIEYVYQVPIPAPGLNQSNRNRSDFWIQPGARHSTAGNAASPRGIVINPFPEGTLIHQVGNDRLERSILGKGGWLEIFVSDRDLTTRPLYIVRQACYGRDESSRK